jgi:hypothetical protein
MSLLEKCGQANGIIVFGKKVKPVLSVIVVKAQFAEVERKLVTQCVIGQWLYASGSDLLCIFRVIVFTSGARSLFVIGCF